MALDLPAPAIFPLPIGVIEVYDLGRLGYRAAYDVQVEQVERVLAARGDNEAERAAGELAGAVLLVEHDPVITVSNRPSATSNLTATPAMLERAGVAVEPTDRGGDITYHGPGQLVVYPILDLNRFHLRLHDYMRLLEETVIRTLGTYGIEGRREQGATGVWVGASANGKGQTANVEGLLPNADSRLPVASSKIAAMGVRVRKWVSMHGLALNVDPDLSHFDLIVPCGLAGRTVTSMRRVLGEGVSMEDVKRTLVVQLVGLLRNEREQKLKAES